MITAYYNVFDGKLKKLKARLKEELKHSKDKRDRKFIRSMVREAKQLRNTLKKMSNMHKITCPNCKQEFTP